MPLEGYFFCWNLPRKWALLEMINYLKKKDCHRRRYNNGEFKKIMKDSGFKIIFFDTHGDILKIKRQIRERIYKKDIWDGFCLDYKFSKLPLINLFSHHITAVCQKI